MRNERKYLVIRWLSIILMAFIVGNAVREVFRVPAATAAQHEGYVMQGAKIYAANCIQCHGPKGEGSVGLALNRKDIRGKDPETPDGKDVFRMITATLTTGRMANSTHPAWERTPDGKFISYTTMPAWSKEHGGPLDNDDINGLAMFLMEPGTQWDLLTPYIKPADLTPDEKTGEIPLPPSENKDVEAQAMALLRDTPKSMCLTCHAIGAKGRAYGPDLSHVGSWGIDQTFLENWIKYANQPNPKSDDKTPAIAHDVRMPVYWSGNRATASGQLLLGAKQQKVSEGPYMMPRFADLKDPKTGVRKLSDDEIRIIARYLMGLK